VAIVELLAIFIILFVLFMVPILFILFFQQVNNVLSPSIFGQGEAQSV